MELTVLFNTIMKLAILIGIGMFLASKIPFTNDIRKMLIFLIVNISLPALILNGFLQVEVEDSLLKQIVIAFIFGCCFILFSLFFGGMAAKLLKFKGNRIGETAFLSAFGNTGFIGIPLCASIFGPKGAVLAAAFDGGTALLVWSLGVLLVQKEKQLTFANFKKMLTPPIYACLLGMLLAFLKFDPGYFIKDVTETLAHTASPLAMIYVGMLTVTIIKEKKKVSAKLVAVPVSLKLLILPSIGLFVLTLFNFPQEIKYLLLIQMTMPSITTSSIIFAMNKADENYALMHTLVTSLLALITIPLLMMAGEFWIIG